MDITITRVPPRDEQAERAILGSMLLDKSTIDEVCVYVGADDFYFTAHQVLFDAILVVHGRDDPPDVITVSDQLGSKLADIGGQGFLVDLVGGIPTTAHAEYYAGIVAEKSALRALIATGTGIVKAAYTGDVDSAAIVELAEKDIIRIASGRNPSQIETVERASMELLGELEARSGRKGGMMGVSSGFQDIDGKMRGWQPDALYILAARPAMGKTALMLNFVKQTALTDQLPVLVFSLEMGEKQLLERIVTAEAGIDSDRLKTGYLSVDEWERVAEVTDALTKSSLIIADSGDASIQQVRSFARRVKAKFPNLAGVYVDYLQLMSGGAGFKGGDNRTQEIGVISRGLKLMARELHVPVMALSQLSRQVEQRADKRPMLSDLRESGSIEADADAVMFIYRDEYYNPETERKNQADLIIAKHRTGPTGTIEMYFDAGKTKFTGITFQKPSMDYVLPGVDAPLPGPAVSHLGRDRNAMPDEWHGLAG